ncbi:MAG TPA: hypothetical protein VG455_15740 [Acidimicrobiales bacterium]|nr:hypothetical protein [Acidimicrobiales bacterium]
MAGAAGLLDESDGLADVLLGEVGGDDAGAFAREGDRCCASGAVAGTGDEGDLAREAPVRVRGIVGVLASLVWARSLVRAIRW